jgi:hypothetical protein
MGIGESKEKINSCCCIIDRKDINNKNRKVTRSKSSKGRGRPVDMPGSMFTPQKAQLDQSDVSKGSVFASLVNLHDSFESGLLSENLPLTSKTNTSKKEVRYSVQPQDWTAAQVTVLKDAVRRTASTKGCKSPGFFAVQVT